MNSHGVPKKKHLVLEVFGDENHGFLKVFGGFSMFFFPWVCHGNMDPFGKSDHFSLTEKKPQNSLSLPGSSDCFTLVEVPTSGSSCFVDEFLE